MRVVGLDIHGVFAEAVMLDEGKVLHLGRIGMTRDHLKAFARRLTHNDHVVVEATGNATAVANVTAPHAWRVVIANPHQVKMIAHAKIKTDTIDATVLVKLYASNFLPGVCRTRNSGGTAAGHMSQSDRPPEVWLKTITQ